MGYGWVRNSIAVDDEGGIYVVSRKHVHKVVWTGNGFSKDVKDGAWVAEYRNSKGGGSGATPALMGFHRFRSALIGFHCFPLILIESP